MEELKLFKKYWNKDSSNFKIYSEQDIYKMIKKNSVSISKILLVFGIIELLIWQFIIYFDDGFSLKKISKFEMFRLIQFFIFLILLINFYYKINIAKNSKNLIIEILNLRKIIIAYIIIIFAGFIYYFIEDYENIAKSAVAGYIDGWNGNEFKHTKINEVKISFQKIIAIVTISAVIFLSFLALIYYLTYGRLLRKLKYNYRELTKLEDNNK